MPLPVWMRWRSNGALINCFAIRLLLSRYCWSSLPRLGHLLFIGR